MTITKAETKPNNATNETGNMKKEIDGTQFASELRAVVKRYMHESDITIFQAIGALDYVRMELWETARNHVDEDASNATTEGDQ